MNLVVHHTHNDELSAIGLSNDSEKSNDDDDEEDDDNGCIEGKLGGDKDFTKLESLPDEDLLRHDIEELGLKEQALMRQSNDDDDDSDEVYIQQKETKIKESGPTPGSSENDAICLSDDENDMTMERESPVSLSDLEKLDVSQLLEKDIMEGVQLQKLQIFEIAFHGPRYGFQISNHAGRVVVKGAEETKTVLSSGDIILAVNGFPVPFPTTFQPVATFMKQSLYQHPPVRVLFGRDEEFKKLYDKLSGFLLAKQTFSSSPSGGADKDSPIVLDD